MYFSSIYHRILQQVLPVMVMGAFVPGLRRRYSILEYVSASLLVLGLVTFTLADAQTSPNFSIMGVVMVVGALVLDAFVGNLQEVIFTLNPATTQARITTFCFLSPYHFAFHFIHCQCSFSCSY